jgi:hypothetical protein
VKPHSCVIAKDWAIRKIRRRVKAVCSSSFARADS